MNVEAARRGSGRARSPQEVAGKGKDLLLAGAVVFFAALAIVMVLIVRPYSSSTGRKSGGGTPVSRAGGGDGGRKEATGRGLSEEAWGPWTLPWKRSNTSPPAVAIVIDDVGLSAEKLDLWLRINAPLTFSVLPYCSLSAELADRLHAAGYQIMLHIPTGNHPPRSYSGEGQLTTGMDRGAVFRTLDADIATVPHAAGINNHQGGLGCDSFQLMMWECEWAKQRGLYVVDSSSSVDSKVSRAAVQLGMGRKKNQVFIDHRNDPEYIRAAMRRLAGKAREGGTAIGICHFGRPYTAEVVGEMVPVLRAEGVNFAFVRDINN